MSILLILKNKWNLDLQADYGSLIDDIYELQSLYNITLPAEMIEYFKIVNGLDNKYLDDLFIFYSVKKIRPLSEEFKDWKGAPDYHKLITEFEHAKDFFVIDNYQSNLFSYAIRLRKDSKMNGEVYIFCGENYKKIAGSLFEFIQLYLNDSIELYYSD